MKQNIDQKLKILEDLLDRAIAELKEHPQYPEGRPVVVGYCRLAHASSVDDPAFEPQVQAIRQACDKRLGVDHYLLHWVYEIASGNLPIYSEGMGPNDYRPRLTLCASLIKMGVAQYIGVQGPSRLARSAGVYAGFMGTVLDPNGVSVITAEAAAFSTESPEVAGESPEEGSEAAS